MAEIKLSSLELLVQKTMYTKILSLFHYTYTYMAKSIQYIGQCVLRSRYNWWGVDL